MRDEDVEDDDDNENEWATLVGKDTKVLLTT